MNGAPLFEILQLSKAPKKSRALQVEEVVSENVICVVYGACLQMQQQHRGNP